jgi:hypothetical protein
VTEKMHRTADLEITNELLQLGGGSAWASSDEHSRTRVRLQYPRYGSDQDVEALLRLLASNCEHDWCIAGYAKPLPSQSPSDRLPCAQANGISSLRNDIDEGSVKSETLHIRVLNGGGHGPEAAGKTRRTKVDKLGDA